MIFDTIRETICWFSIVLGSLLVFLGSIGFLRFPEFWSRLHAASIIDSGGMLLIIVGLGFASGLTLVTIKLVIIAIFLIITGPTATHAIANAALVSGLRLNKNQKKKIEDNQ